MGIKFLKLKPVINKKNGQVNVSLRKKDLPISIRKNPELIKKIKLKMEGFDV